MVRGRVQARDRPAVEGDAQRWRVRGGTEPAESLGCHRVTVARAARTAKALFDESWIAQPVTGDAIVLRSFGGPQRARKLMPGNLSVGQLYAALFGNRVGRADVPDFSSSGVQPSGDGVDRARRAGSFSVRVRAHEQDAEGLAELAEKLEALMALETVPASPVRLGRPVAALLTAEEGKTVDLTWLEDFSGRRCGWSG